MKPSSVRKLIVLPLWSWEDKPKSTSEILITSSVTAKPEPSKRNGWFLEISANDSFTK